MGHTKKKKKKLLRFQYNIISNYLNSQFVESPFKQSQRVADEIVDLRFELLFAFHQFAVFLVLNGNLLFDAGFVSRRLK